MPLCLRRWRSNADFPVTLLPHWSQKKTGSFCFMRGFFGTVVRDNRRRRLSFLGTSYAPFSSAIKSSPLMFVLQAFVAKWSMPSSFGLLEFSNLINVSTGLIGASSMSSPLPAFRSPVRVLRRTQITWVTDGSPAVSPSMSGDVLICHLLWLRRQRLRNSMAQSKSFWQLIHIESGKSGFDSNCKCIHLPICQKFIYNYVTYENAGD